MFKMNICCNLSISKTNDIETLENCKFLLLFYFKINTSIPSLLKIETVFYVNVALITLGTLNSSKQNKAKLLKLLNFVLTKEETQTRVRTGYLKKGGIHAWLTLVNSYQIKTYLSLITDHDKVVKSSIIQVWFKTYIKGKYFFLRLHK